NACNTVVWRCREPFPKAVLCQISAIELPWPALNRHTLGDSGQTAIGAGTSGGAVDRALGIYSPGRRRRIIRVHFPELFICNLLPVQDPLGEFIVIMYLG